MNITSHFIGIKINSRTFVDLVVKLQQYLKDSNAEQAIELQDIHSLHVSLYYLQKEISSQERNNIKKTIATFTKSHKDFVLTSDHVDYFKKAETDYLCYITCSQVRKLSALNNQLANEYKKDQIPDNQYAYIPHISLFRVRNHKLFITHKDNIDNIIEQILYDINNENLFKGFYLFEVNSKFHPEIQFIVNSF